MDPLSLLIEGILRAKTWIKARLISSSNETPVNINSTNVNYVIKNIKSKRDVNIIVISPRAGEDSETDKAINDTIETIGKVIDAHAGSIIFDDDVYVFLKAPPFTSKQAGFLERAKKLGWNNEKILAMRFAFKVINLEDAKKCKEALEIFESMLKSRKSLLLKRMYNFTRSGLIEEFMLKSIFGGFDYSDAAMDKKLAYFPDAIFVNEYMDVNTLESDLVRRANERVRKVRIYARGNSNIAALQDCLEVYREKHIKSSSIIYLVTHKETYEIGCTPGETTTLELFAINEDLERIMAHREKRKETVQ